MTSSEQPVIEICCLQGYVLLSVVLSCQGLSLQDLPYFLCASALYGVKELNHAPRPAFLFSPSFCL